MPLSRSNSAHHVEITFFWALKIETNYANKCQEAEIILNRMVKSRLNISWLYCNDAAKCVYES